jgi:hypothetical protein
MNVHAILTCRTVLLLTSLLLALAGRQSKETTAIDTSSFQGVKPILVHQPGVQNANTSAPLARRHAVNAL